MNELRGYLPLAGGGELLAPPRVGIVSSQRQLLQVIVNSLLPI